MLIHKIVKINSHHVSKAYKVYGLFLLSIFFFFSSTVFAEGSKELNANGGNRAFLISHLQVSATNPFPTLGTMKVFVNAGETLYLGSSAMGMGDGTIVVRRPSGGAVPAPAPGTGLISNRAQELAGPRTPINPTGYIPYAIPVTETGVWEVDFYSPDITPGGNVDPSSIASTGNWTQGNNTSYISAFDVSVGTPTYQIITGRVFTNIFIGYLASFSATFNPVFKIVTKDGYQYDVDNNGQAGNGFAFFVNNKGFRNGTNASYQSVNSTTGINVHDPRAPDSGTDITHKIFFNTPDNNPLTGLPTVADAVGGQTWLLREPESPVVTNFTFTGKEGTPNVAGTSNSLAQAMGGYISFNANQAGSYIINMDINGDGDFVDLVDRKLTGSAVVGLNSIYWDGLNGQGAKVTGTVTFGPGSMEIMLRAGEVHFPFIDVENNVSGMIIRRTNGVGLPNNIVYWDDTNIAGGTKSAVSGNNSATAGHKWGSTGYSSVAFGNERGLDTWTYVVSNPISSAVTVSMKEANLEVISIARSENNLCVGKSQTYTIRVRNNGPSSVEGATFRFQFPPQFTGVSGSWSDGTSGSVSIPNSWYEAVVDMNSLEELIFTVSGTVSAMPAGNVLPVTASIMRPADVTDPDATNTDNAPPSDPQLECDSAPSGVGCNNVKTNSTIVVSPNITISPASLSEGSSLGVTNMNFTVSLSVANPGCVVAVDYAVANVNTSAADFLGATSGTLIIPIGETSAIISIPVNADKLIEANETFTVTLSNPSAGQITVGMATGTIIDDDNAPVSVVVGANAAEPATNGQFIVQFPPGVSSSVTTVVTYSVAGTALSNVDYAALPGSVTIPAFANSAFINLNVLDDKIIEANETVSITLSAVNSAIPTTIVPGTATATIADDDITAGVITLTKVRDGEEGGVNGQFMVGFAAGYTTTVPTIITYQIAGSAINGTDYTTLSGSVVIPAGAESAVIDVLVFNDLIIEGDEAVTLSNLTATNSLGVLFSYAPLTPVSLTIKDNDNIAPQVTVIAVNGSEPGTNGRFRISFATNVTSSVPTNVVYVLSGTATNGLDYSNLGTTAVIPAGVNFVDLILTVIDDKIIEGNETVILTLSSVINSNAPGLLYTNTPATAFIIDDDNTTPNNNITLTKVNDGAEPGTSIRFKVSFPLGVTSSQNSTITYAVGGTAGSNVDFTSPSGVVEITAGSNAQFITIPVLDDNISEPTETIVLTLTSAVNSISSLVFVPDNPVSADILDDENVGPNNVITLVHVNDGAEPGTSALFKVKYPGAIVSAAATTVTYSILGSATNGTDYATLSGSVVIPAGANSADIPVLVVDDKIIEGTETVVLAITSASNTIASSLTYNPTSVIAEVADDDNGTPNNIITLTKIQDGFEAGSAAQFRVGFPIGITSSVATIITYSISGSALNGTDYGTLSGVVTIPAGANFALISLPVVDDLIIEGTENVSLILTNASNAVASLEVAPNTAVVADIFDNDNNSPNVELVKVRDGAEGGVNPQYKVSFPVNLTSSADTKLNYTIGGTAINGTDYATLSGSVIIPAGDNSAFIDVLLNDDLIIEGPENVSITITSISNTVSPTLTFSPGTSQIATIADNDSGAPNNIVRLALEQHGSESGTAARFSISFPPGLTSSGETTVNYSIAGTAFNGTDYATLSGVILIPAGENSASLNIPVVDDLIIEGNETIELRLTSATTTCGCPLTVQPGTAVIANIIDNDNIAASSVITLTKISDGAEPGTNARFQVSLPAGTTSAANTTVSYNTAGSAVNAVDYHSLNGTVVIPAGTSSAFIDVIIKDDFIIEGDETVSIALTGVVNPIPASSFTIGSTLPVTALIADNDNETPNNILTLRLIQHGAEPGTNVIFRVSFPDMPNIITSAAATYISYNVSGTAQEGTDFGMLSGVLTIPAGANYADIIVPVMDDNIIEGTETMGITLNWATNPLTGLTVQPTTPVTADILDNDDVPPNNIITLSKVKDAAEPFGNGQYLVSFPLGVTSSVATVVNYLVAPLGPGVAIPGVDYEALTGSVTILPGANSALIDIIVIDDLNIESVETVNVALSAVTNAVTTNIQFSTLEVPLNILDDETNPLSPANQVTLKTVSNGKEPGTSAIFEVGYPQGVTAVTETTVQYAISGTAQNGIDYETISGTVIIPEGTNSSLIEIKVKDDKIIEPVETVSLKLISADNNTGTTLSVSPGIDVVAEIADDDNLPPYNVITIKRVQSGSEPASDAEFEIGFPHGYSSSVATTIKYSVSGTAANGVDYEAISGSVTIPPLANSAIVLIDIRDDLIIEGIENVGLTITEASSIVADPQIMAGTAFANIADDDNTIQNNTLTLSLVRNGNEPSINPQFQIGYPAGISSAVDTYVNYTIAGTAINGTDYAALNGVAIIPANQNAVLIDIGVIDDKIIEGTESVSLKLVSAGNALVNSIPLAPNLAVTATIGDDDNVGQLEMDLVHHGSEPTINARFKVGFPTGKTRSIETVLEYIVGGTATADKDYRALSGIVKIPAGEEFAYIDVEVLNDQLIEPTETVTIKLNALNTVGDNSILIDLNTETANIIDDDFVSAALSLIKISDGAEPGSNVIYRVSYNNGLSSSLPTVVTYSSSGGTATSGLDYVPLTHTVIIPAEQNSVDIVINVLDDKLIEQTEQVVLSLLTANNTIQPLTFSTSGVAANIIDEDLLNRITLQQTVDAKEPNINGRFRIGFESADIVSTVNTTVNFIISGSAINGTDYQPIAGSAQILAGNNYIDIDILVLDDKIIEGTETINLSIISATSSIANPDVISGTGVVNILDDDNTPANNTITLTRIAHGAEPATNARFSVSFGPGITATTNTRVNYTVGGTALNSLDFDLLNGSVVIPAGLNSAVIDVLVKDDKIIEGTETVALKLVSAQNDLNPALNLEPVNAVSANILDNDNVAPYTILELSKDADAEESGGNGLIKVSFPTGYSSSVPTILNYSVGGTALHNQDYQTLSGSVTIPAGESAAYINIEAIDDQKVEGNETVEITITSITNTALAGSLTVNTNTIVVLIRDDDQATLTIGSPVSKVEGDAGITTMSFDVKLSKETSSGFQVFYTTADGTATTADNDYVPVPVALSKTFLGTKDEIQTITISVIGDKMIERNEDFQILLSDPSNNFGGNLTLSSSSATGIIVDDDNTVDNKKITITKTDGAEAGSDAIFTFSFPTDVSADVATTIPFTMDGTALGNTVLLKDYDISHIGSVVIPAAANSVSLLIPVIDDHILEATETVTMNAETLANSRYSGIIVANTPLSLNIADNDNATLTLTAPVTITEGDLGQKIVTFYVKLNNAVGQPFEVNFATIDGTARVADQDYAQSQGKLSFDGTENEERAIEVVIYGDRKIESNESFSLELSNISVDFDGRLVINNSPAEAIINDDDNIIANKSIIITTVNGAEGGADASVSFSFPAGVSSDGTTSIPYTLGGTASGNGIDYNVSPTGTLTLLPGQNSVTLLLPVVDDALIEANETVIVSSSIISNDKYAGITLSNAPQTLTIADNDGAFLTISNAQPITEGQGGSQKVVFEVKLNNNIGGGFTLGYNTADGTALASDNDYVPVNNGVLTFAGTADEVQYIEVLVIGDKKIERDEEFQVLLSSPSTNFGGRLILSNTSAKAVIIDDDNIPANKEITVSTLNGTEGIPNAGFTFRLPDNVSIDVSTTINYTLSGTATGNNVDYNNPTVGSVTIPANSNSVTLTINVIDDAALEATETAILTTGAVTNSNYSNITVLNSPATLLIDDNDNASITVNPVVVTEGDGNIVNAVFTVSLSNPTGGPFTLQYRTLDGTAAVADNDYVSTAGTLSFSGLVAQTFDIVVPVLGDTKIEQNETFSLELSNPSFDFDGRLVVYGSPAEGKIIDNDNIAANKKITITKVDGGEGTNDARFKFSLPPSITIDDWTTIAYNLTGSAIGNDVDYAALSGGSIIIPAGENNVTLTLPIIDDDIIEEVEEVILTTSIIENNSFTDFTVSNSGISLNITDNDIGELTLSGPIVVFEGNTGPTLATLSVMLTGSTGSSFSVGYSTIDGTARAADNDYVFKNASLNFSGTEGEVQNITILVNGDFKIENDEEFNVVLRSVSNTFGGKLTFSRQPSIVKILNDDNGTIEITKVDAKEGVGGGSFKFSLPDGVYSDKPIIIPYTLSGSAFGNGLDYTASSTGSVTLPAGQRSTTLNLVVIDDAIIEPEESVKINTGIVLSNYPDAVLVTNSPQELYIADNDSVAIVVTNPVITKEGNSGYLDAVFDVTLPMATAEGFAFDFSTADGTATVLDEDYVAGVGKLTFVGQADETHQIKVRIKGDIVMEDDEDYFLNFADLTNPFEGRLTFKYLTVKGVIHNDDRAPVANADVVTTPEDTPITFPILTNDTDVDGIDPTSVVVKIFPEMGDVDLHADGTITYRPVFNDHGTYYFTYTVKDITGLESNEAKVTISVTPVNDTPIAEDDSFYVLREGVLRETVRVNDSDPDGDLLTFRMLVPPTKGQMVSFNRVDGAFIYSPHAGEFTGYDTFTYEVMDPAGLTDEAVVTIGIQPNVKVTLTPSTATLKEGDTITLTVELSEPLLQPVEVFIGYGGTAENGTDYNLAGDHERLLIAAGEVISNQKIEVSTIKDYLKEGDETLLVEIVSATPSAFITIESGSEITLQELYPDDKPTGPDENGDINPDPLTSPNGDGIGNERFIIHNIEKYPDNEVVIFNRWGNEVFRMKGYNNSDKSFAGYANTGLLANANTPLIDGVYFFLIHSKNSDGVAKLNKGYVIVKR